MTKAIFEASRPGPLASARRGVRLPLALTPLVFLLAAAPAARVESPPQARWSLVHRLIVQDQGDWWVDYALRLDAASAVVLAPGDLEALIEGWVSNSRVPVHAVPRRSAPRVSGATGGTSAFEMIPSPDDAKACRERLVFRAWPAGSPESPIRPKSAPPLAPDPVPACRVEPGGLLRVRLRLEHEHFLYGPYDPLLGHREVTLTLGATTVRDVLPIDREHYLATATPAWPAPPADRLDTRHSVSGPDSLHLEAHVAGNQCYRFEEKPVRYASRMRLSYWYLIAPGGEGEFRLRVIQYKESPSGWQVLPPADFPHAVVGRWTKVERLVKTEAEATSLALDFSIQTPTLAPGEVWVDDVKLEPAGPAPGGP